MHDTFDGIYYDVLLLDNINTKEEAINYMADYLEKKGYVNSKYAAATIEREHVYPTGLATKPIGVAVAHSQSENVMKQSVLLGITKKPIKFCKMEDDKCEIDVGIIFMLALKGENTHLNYLKNIVNFCKYEDKTQRLYSVSSAEEAYKIFISEILKIDEK
ncbi:MAG: putative IIA-like nitrogen-regulatory protein PtsN [Clostridiaceae bacterium]|jgi:PTS system galactitol-specific IIA component|nr:putative IIA-like nitrogen-regulatory protein PtsN [Clostridiaceae bacterium]